MPPNTEMMPPADVTPTVNVRRMLDLVMIRKRPCRACGRDLWFLRTRNGREAPYTDQATNHFIDCPAASAFRRSKTPREA